MEVLIISYGSNYCHNKSTWRAHSSAKACMSGSRISKWENLDLASRH